MSHKLAGFVLAVAASAFAGCGASQTEVRNAQAAMYYAPPSTIVEIAKQVVGELGYTIGENDALASKFTTAPKFFGPQGTAETPGADGFDHMPDGSVQAQFTVQVVITAERRTAVLVTPITLQKVGSSPKPRELEAEDPNLPTFVQGRADAISVQISQRARKYTRPGAH